MIEGEYSMNTDPTMARQHKVEVHTPEAFEQGFGFGEGDISHSDRAAVVGPETVQAVEGAIKSPNILIPVSRDKSGKLIEDDGCGDGRNVLRVFMGMFQKAKSLVRPKIFGGGATMVSAMEIGSGNANGSGLNQLFKNSIAQMRRNKIDFGAHTDTHAQGENCGCGAIDKAPQVLENIVKYDPYIRNAINNMGVDTTGLDDVLGNFSSYTKSVEGEVYSGKEVMNDIVSEGKIVKELDDHHYEMFVLLNMTEGYTVNQELIRKVSGDKVQVFAVDVWRMQALAVKRFPDDPEAQNTAFISELVYTLGVSATLTKGDLPVKILQSEEALVAA